MRSTNTHRRISRLRPRRAVNGDKPIRDFKATLWRWRDDFQNDFAARMDWTTKPFSEANHPPVPVLSHPDAFTVKSGQGFGSTHGAARIPTAIV